nr:transposase, mutator type [Tanacetum cinerariifolium]
MLVNHTGWKLCCRQWAGTTEQLIEELESVYDNAPNMFLIRIHHGGKFQRATLEEITDEAGSIEANRAEKMLLLTWHESSETTKELVCEFVTPSSLPQHDSSTPCKDSVCESITPRCMPDCILTPPSDESVIIYTHQVIDDVRQLSFDETELDGKAGFADVAGSDVDSSGLSHYESFGVNTQEPIVTKVSTEVPIVDEVETQEFSVEDVVLENYVSSGKDVEQGTNDDDDVDEDFLVNKENEIVEPDVDVHLFGISMDLPFDNIGITNLMPDDVLEGEEVDVINADGFDSDPGNDEEKNYMKRRVNLDILVKAVQDQLQRELEVQISMSKAFRAKAKAEREIREDHVLVIPAIKPVYPSAKHKYCLRYIHENMKHGWCGQAYKDLLWRVASATNVRNFEKRGNNTKANGSASRKAQQTKLAVGRDGSDGSGVGAVIGLSVAAGEGGAGGPGVASQECDGREMGDCVPTQSSAAGGASEWSFKTNLFQESGLGGGGHLRDYVRIVDGADDRGKSKIGIGLGGGGYLRDYVRVVGGTDDGDMPSEAVEQGIYANAFDEIDGAKGEQVTNHVVKKCNFEFFVCKELANPDVNELVDKGRPL